MATRHGREVDGWCSEFEKLCRSRGIRVTAQRLAVYRALAEDLAHPTAESVYSRLSISGAMGKPPVPLGGDAPAEDAEDEEESDD